jgi:hypothetical protein
VEEQEKVKDAPRFCGAADRLLTDKRKEGIHAVCALIDQRCD